MLVYLSVWASPCNLLRVAAVRFEANKEGYVYGISGARIKRAIRQFWKYCVVGASGYVINFGVFSIFYGFAHIPYFMAATFSFMVAATNNFLLNKYWTFSNPQGQVATQAGRFVIVSVASWAMNMVLLVTLIEVFSFNEYIAQGLSISAVTVLNFTGNKLWSFRQPTA